MTPAPVTGTFRPEEDATFEKGNHMQGWNIATDRALEKYDRGSPGEVEPVTMVFTAQVERVNPGSVIEYAAHII